MLTLNTIKDMIQYINKEKRSQRTIGFVPTMGYLHSGHRALIDQSKKDNDITIVSIFVNPLQFNQSSDLEQYPRDFERDAAILKRWC